jgi:hypothetical protein
MVSLRGDRVELKEKSPMIVDDKGSLVLINASYGETFGLAVQKYKNEYLKFLQGDGSVGEHGEGYYFIIHLVLYLPYQIHNPPPPNFSLTDTTQLDSTYK